MNKLIAYALLVCLLCLGCKTVSTNVINVHEDIAYHDIRTLAVMRFDDKGVKDKEISGFLLKTIPNPEAGEMICGMMTNELSKWGRYNILSRNEIKSRLKARDVKEEELVRRKDYIALGKILKADAVIIGKIHKFELSNITIYERSNVSFAAECIDTKNGKILWSVETNKSAPYKDELELAGNAVKEVVEKLKSETE